MTLQTFTLGTFAQQGVAVGDFESIATISVGSGGAADINFTSIGTDWTHLQIRGILRSDRAVTVTNSLIQFNNDTASNYSWHYLEGNGTSASAGAGASQTRMYGNVVSASSTASVFSGLVLDVLDYKDTNKFKTMRLLDGYDANGSGTITLWSGNWRSTSAITSIKISLGGFNFVQYSTLALYGIKAA